MKKSSRVKYETLGKSAPTANRYAISVSMVVMATLIWIPDSSGSIQKTIQDMATIRINGRITFTTILAYCYNIGHFEKKLGLTNRAFVCNYLLDTKD